MRVISQSVDDQIFDVETVFDVYSGRGTAAHPPDLLLKLAIYEHCRGQTKPIQWHRDLKSDIKVQWLTFGMKVTRKALYRFRDRVGSLLEDWHKQVLELAVAEELVDGHQASIDGTTVAANASRRKLANMQQIEKRLEQLENAMLSSPETTSLDTPGQDSADPSQDPGWMAKTDTGKLGQHARYLKAKERLTELHAENKKRRSDKRKPEEKIVVSLTDPESVFGRDKEKVYRPLYNVQTVSDLATDFVLAYEVFAQHSDSGTLQYSGMKTRQRANGETIPFDVYRASPLDCTACPLQARCTTVPEKGRTVRRDPHQEEIDRLKTRMQTDQAKRLYKRRGQTIERVFADFKEHRNLRRFRGRGLTRARTQTGLTVLGHNLRIISKLREIKKQEADNAIAPKNAA